MVSWNSMGEILNTSGIGSGWQPKQSRIRVGRDVGLLSATAFSGKPSRNMVLGHGDDVILKSKLLFQTAKSATQNGGSIDSFRRLAARLEDSGQDKAAPGGIQTIHKNGDYVVSYDPADEKSGIRILKKNEDDEYDLIASAAANQDVRISWGEKGEPQFFTGAAALNKGSLAAKGTNEVLFRHSEVDVVAGSGTTVFNLSSTAGTYSGGDGVTYLGNYRGGTFKDTGGSVNFAGYFNQASFSGITGKSEFSGVFENSEINVEKSESTFSGYFSGSQVTGGKSSLIANGLFMNGSIVKGSEEADDFSGRFIDSSVDGGDGNDSFGRASSMSHKEILAYQAGNQIHLYNGIASDFVNSTVSAGSGNDKFAGVMWGGSFDAVEGENSIRGIFGQATINGGKDNDDISSAYSYASTFNTGFGDDAVNLTTSTKSTVNTDEGKNTVSMGKNNPGIVDPTWQTRDDYISKRRPSETGELQNNTVNAEKGENTVGIHNGESTVAALNGEALKEKTSYEGQTAEDTPANSKAKNESSSPLSPSEELLNLLTAEPGFIESATKETPKANAQDKKTGYAVERYRKAMGFDPLEQGDPAVTVNTGIGESQTFYGTKRYNTFEEDDRHHGIRMLIRPGDNSGTYSWKRWEKL